MAEHFAAPPGWTWYIALYFFLAGLAGGSYVLATIMRLRGSSQDAPIVRIGYLLPLPLVVVCALFLTLDLGTPLRFWHMLINTTPGDVGLNFHYWSPMSVGVWALSIFGAFTLLSFLEARGNLRRLPVAIPIVGSLFALYLASYTGVLLSVSNQPVWSDTWALGGLFLASGLSGSAALLVWLGRYVNGAPQTEARLSKADGYFALLELAFIVAFFITIAIAGTIGKTVSPFWAILWILVLLSLLPGIRALVARREAPESVAASVAVIAGVLLMRLVIVFSAQS
ncbi:MAG TPA: NrfD/PsrC family molybdoenzyme membrane anchor subunit [Candidatus Acidoferrum sp.]|nr:NrfD/PsrC family molybdoenzyme membrane anchor subunit [Candidatus Acidoferrum sp.]